MVPYKQIVLFILIKTLNLRGSLKIKIFHSLLLYMNIASHQCQLTRLNLSVYSASLDFYSYEVKFFSENVVLKHIK